MRLATIVSSLMVTVFLLIVLEILSSAFLPKLVFDNLRIPFNVLIILFLAFKLETPYLPLIIMVVQLTHGAFSIEGWALGTFTGIIISIIISYLRDLIDLKSAFMTIIMCQVFQVVWLLITFSVYYTQTDTVSNLGLKLNHFIFESIIISLLSPFFFSILDRIWKVDSYSSLGVEG